MKFVKCSLSSVYEKYFSYKLVINETVCSIVFGFVRNKFYV